MAGLEGLPRQLESPEVEAHLAPRKPVNVRGLFATYLRIRDGEEIPQEALLHANQRLLIEDPRGVIIRQALDQVAADSRNGQLIWLATFYLPRPDGDEVFEQLASEIGAIL